MAALRSPFNDKEAYEAYLNWRYGCRRSVSNSKVNVPVEGTGDGEMSGWLNALQHDALELAYLENARLRDENEQMKQMLRPEQVLIVEQTALRNQEARERAK